MFEILHELSNWIKEFAETDWAILILFVTAFLESTISPIPPDPLLIPMGIINPSSAIWLGALCTLASVLGAVLGHRLGSQFGRPLLRKFVSETRIQSGESLFDKYGIWAVLVAAVTPIPYKVFTILAGVLKLDMKRFLIASIIGRGMRFLSLGVVIFLFGEDVQHFVEEQFETLTLLAGVGVVASVLFVVILAKWKTKRRSSRKQSDG
ncbi:MAG: VTT domain-containing protein [Chloroflexota bacterium]|jgi:undecaprenyl-diphosphatase|uniref:VTT domain-containing protein n=1 Tax=marine metagenome TaxID=408172 RepID=A0A381MY40_9ZZZZ|nr:VTT domain-containing protein [Chloroflexota bacterium]|tara:strand:- start:836 stop:1459 length:624 start_codon:yes stop_codon:yes gene_type:complete